MKTRAIVIVVIGGLIAVAAVFGVRRAMRPAVIEPPVLADERGVEPQVLALIGEFRDAVQRNPRDPRAWAQLGMAYDANTYRQLATTCYRQALDLDDDDARLWYYLAHVLAEEADLDGALIAMDEASTRDEDAPQCHWQQGFWLLDLGRTEEAEAALFHASELAPDAPACRVGLGLAALQQEDATTAAAHFEKVLSQPDAPNQPYIRNQLAIAYQRLERDDADQLRSGRSSSRPRWPDPWQDELSAYRLFRLWVLAEADRVRTPQQREIAIAKLRRIYAASPADAEAVEKLSRLLYLSGKAEEALALLEQALLMNPNLYAVRINLAVAYRESGRLEEAMTHARRAVELQPAAGIGHYQLGHVLIATGDYERAIPSLRRVLTLDGVPPNTRVLLGEALCRTGRWDHAIEAIGPATQINPAFPEGYVWLGRAHAELGDVAHGAALLQRAQQVNPRTPGLEENLRRLQQLQ